YLGERAALRRKRQKEDPEMHAKYKEKEHLRYKKRREESPPNSPTDNSENIENIQPKKRGRKRSRKENATAYRDLFQLRVKFDCERRLKEKYKKRANRLSKSIRKKTDIDKEEDKKMKSEEIRKALTLRLIMVRNMKAMNGEAINRDKKLLREIVCRDRILKKYKLGKHAQGILEMKVNQKSKRQTEQRQPPWIKIMVVDYFERDNNSRIMGIETFLCYKTNRKHRETCLCKHHENIQFKINKIFHEKALETNNLDELLINNLQFRKQSVYV
ncbi:hypothetical protein MAR_024502, partial [Mya arenaria]